MGGDGGTKAVNRSYLRGAGAATTSADLARHTKKDPAVAAEEAARALTHCAISDQPLDFSSSSSIVVCPYGRLYNREAAVEALIRRKHQDGTTSSAEGGKLLGSHIRGLKDLYSVKFQINEAGLPLCPVTARELTGKGVAAYALIPSDDGSVNVVSENALKELGEDELLQEYGATSKILLAPPPKRLTEIQEEWEEHCAAEKAAKKNKKAKNKRKHENENGAHRKKERKR